MGICLPTQTEISHQVLKNFLRRVFGLMLHGLEVYLIGKIGMTLIIPDKRYTRLVFAFVLWGNHKTVGSPMRNGLRTLI